MRKTIAALLLPLLLTILGACAHRAEVHPARETVLFEGIEFKVNSRELRYNALSVSGKSLTPDGVFVIVEVALKNSYTAPVPAQFQPRFSLVDASGREHAVRKEIASAPKGAVSNPDELSPQTSYTKKLVFDVPEGDYRLRVFTPIIVKPGPQGSMQGRFFYYDLGTGR